MRYNRVIIAKVALGVASEDEIFWVNSWCQESDVCRQALADLKALASAAPSMTCVDPLELIEAGDTNKMTSETQDHIVNCNRCARIGWYVSAMPFPNAGTCKLSLTA